MTLKETDDALAAWNNRLAAVAANLLELQADATYRSLTGTGGVAKAQFTGSTAARLEPALRAMPSIFEQFGLLHALLDKAAKLRGSLPALFGGEAKLRELEQLLRGTSIPLPAPELSLDERSLLSGVHAAAQVSPEELLHAMTAAFAATRDAVLAVGEAWDTLASGLPQSERSRAQMEARMACLSAKPVPELEAIAGILPLVRARVAADPLGALTDLRTRVHPLLAAAAKQIEAAESLRSQIIDARRHMEELGKLHREVLAAMAEARAKISDPEPLPAPVPEEKLQALREWLDRLDRKRTEGVLEAVAVGLRRWGTAAENCAAQDRHASARSRAPLEARAELRGRLGALKAKARVYGIAEDEPVAALAQGAEVLLYTQPTDLRRSATAVSGYEQTLQHARKEERRA